MRTEGLLTASSDDIRGDEEQFVAGFERVVRARDDDPAVADDRDQGGVLGRLMSPTR